MLDLPFSSYTSKLFHVSFSVNKWNYTSLTELTYLHKMSSIENYKAFITVQYFIILSVVCLNYCFDKGKL